jgi:multidrug efflux pump subunit AcrB
MDLHSRVQYEKFIRFALSLLGGLLISWLVSLTESTVMYSYYYDIPIISAIISLYLLFALKFMKPLADKLYTKKMKIAFLYTSFIAIIYVLFEVMS